MKKLLSIVAGVAFATSAFAQGTVSFANTSLTLVNTNGVNPTAPAAQGFYYALFIQSYNGSVTGNNNVLTGGWSFSGNYATNTIATAGGRFSGGTATVAGWGIDVTNQFMVVGWSSNLGNTWGSVSNQLSTSSWAANGFFGESAVGFGAAGGTVNGSSFPTFALFSTTGATGLGTPIQTGFTLNPVSAPEPTTLALAGLSGASLLLFRRRK